ncbi:hypothetical protein ABW20_dc0101846 [Dactylellina cionopaga]|nr:hypothetical protein ABW20_dc0101846 [Dactylellina cionopaga]
MADSDAPQHHTAEKAEKLAAARKRFEELKRKKQPSKKATSTSHRDVLGSAVVEISETAQGEQAELVAGILDHTSDKPGIDKSNDSPETDSKSLLRNPTQSIEAESSPTTSAPVEQNNTGNEYKRQEPTVTSEIPRQSDSSVSGNDGLLETLPEIYRKQASVIDELRTEKQNLLDEIRTLQNRAQESKKIMVERDKALEDLASMSDELQALREKIGAEQATFREGAGEVSTLKSEAASLYRQITHLQSQLTQKDKAIMDMRRESNLVSPPRSEEILRVKEEQLEGMSVELSELRASLEAAVSSTKGLTLERNLLELRIVSLNAELEKSKKSTDELNLKLSCAADTLATDTARTSAIEAKTRTQEQTIEDLKNEVTRMITSISQLNNLNQELQISQKDSEARFREMEKRLNIAQRENTGMQMRLAELKSSLHQSFVEKESQGKQLARPPGSYDKIVDTIEGISKPHQSSKEGGEESTVPFPKEQAETSEALHERKSQPLAEGFSQNLFSDIDLVTKLDSSDSSPTLHNRRISQNQISENDPLYIKTRISDREYQERPILPKQVREVLGRWRGYHVDLVDVYGIYDDSYSRIFGI